MPAPKNITPLFRQCVTPEEIARGTDKYFSRTREIVEANGESTVTYSVFIRHPIVLAPAIAVDWLNEVAKVQNFSIKIELDYKEGEVVPSATPFMYITGPFSKLAELETHFLAKLGAASVAAYNAREMCMALPDTPFLAMDPRHCTGPEMSEIMAYAASVGSKAARKEAGAKGFIGGSNDIGAPYFGNKEGLGTIPHALIGYAGSTLKAAQMFRQTHPDKPLTVLNDFFGQEVTDSIEVCKYFKDLADKGELSFRLDTHGGRYLEGLDEDESYKVLARHLPESALKNRTDEELKVMVGKGVSIAAIYYFREQMDAAGFDKVRIVASSGFNPAKCKIVAETKAPVDVIGTGSFLPGKWSETYATADIIAYDGRFSVKQGREYLIEHYKKNHGTQQPKADLNLP